MKSLSLDVAQQLSDRVLFRIVRGDEKGRPFGTPRNPAVPTLNDFNPRIVEIRAGDLEAKIVARRHGLSPEQSERISEMSNDELVRFRLEDPISASQIDLGLSLTGGHHRTHEITERVLAGLLSPETIIEVLVHD